MSYKEASQDSILKLSYFTPEFHNERYENIFKKYEERLLSFDFLGKKAHVLAKELAENLNKKYGQKTTLDYGNEELVSEYHDKIYVEISDEFTCRNHDWEIIGYKFFIDSWSLFEIIESNPDSPELWIENLIELTTELEDLLLFVLMNDEIIDAIYRFHYQRFSRKFYPDLWTYVSKNNQQFVDFMYNIELVSVFYRIEKIVKGLKRKIKLKKLERIVRASVNIRHNEIMSASNHLNIFKLVEGLISKVGFMNDLIGSHQAFLTRSSGTIREEYQSEKYYNAKFEENMKKENGCRVCLGEFKDMINDSLGHMKESAVYNKLDLFLACLHVFFGLANTYSFAISAYLYTEELNLDPAISGAIQAAVPLGSFCFGFLWNYVTSFKSYKLPMLVSIFLTLVGNVLYYLVQMLKSTDGKASLGGIVLLVVSRLILGVGGARLMLRKYIAMSIKQWAQTTYSALFVAISFSAVCLGPALQAVIFFKPNKCDLVLGTQMCWHNMAAYVYIWIYFVLFFLFLFFFTGFDKQKYLYQEAHKYKVIFIFSNLHELNFRKAINEIKLDYINEIELQNLNPIEIREKVEEEEQKMHEGALELLKSSLKNPFLAFYEKEKLQKAIKEIEEKEEEEKELEENEQKKKNNESKSDEKEIKLKENKNKIELNKIQKQKNKTISLKNENHNIFPAQKYSMPDPNEIAWKSKRKYVVYQPFFYTFFVTVCLFFIKVF